MTIFQTTQSYASELDLKFDEEKQKYLGEFISRGGVYQIEGVDRADVEYEMERLLREEYLAMERDVANKKSFVSRVEEEAQKNVGRGIGGGGGSGQGSSHKNNRKPDIISGHKVFNIDADARGRPVAGHSSGLHKAVSTVDLVTGFSALARGDFISFGISLISLLIEDLLLGGGAPSKKLFAVMFGGVLITATSRRQLMKKLQRQKNHRIQNILMHLRKLGLVDGDPEDETRGLKGEQKSAERLKAKKKKALILRPKKWEMRVSPQGQETGWRGRSLDMRDRMKDKKERNKALWVHKLG